MIPNLFVEHSNLNVSVACEPGTFKDDSLFTCQSCGSELVPNSDKTLCGKSSHSYQILHQIQIYQASILVTDELLNVNFVLMQSFLITSYFGVTSCLHDYLNLMK